MNFFDADDLVKELGDGFVWQTVSAANDLFFYNENFKYVGFVVDSHLQDKHVVRLAFNNRSMSLKATKTFLDKINFEIGVSKNKTTKQIAKDIKTRLFPQLTSLVGEMDNALFEAENNREFVNDIIKSLAEEPDFNVTHVIPDDFDTVVYISVKHEQFNVEITVNGNELSLNGKGLQIHHIGRIIAAIKQ